MRQTTWPIALLSFFLLAADDESDPPPPPPPIGIEVQATSGARIVSAILPGPVGDFAMLSEGQGRLVLRADPKDEDSELWVIELGEDPHLEKLNVPTGPHPGSLFAADFGGPTREILLGGEQGVQAISLKTGKGRQVLDQGLMERPQLARYRNASRQLNPVDIELGNLSSVKVSGQELSIGPPIALPMRARRFATGLLLDSPIVTALPREDGGPIYLVGPETQGLRLRTIMIDPNAAEDERVQESWARLPGPEEVQYSWYARINGHIRLIVATKSSDKMGIFEKMALRVFPVSSDPTRGGRNALLKAETETIWWNEMDVQIADIDGDGSEEMVVLQPNGLSGDDLEIEAYEKGASTGFAFSPRNSSVKDVGSCWVYGRDVDGDGHPDLVARHHDQIVVHPGLAHRKKKGIVEKNSSFSLLLPDDSPSRRVEISIGSSGTEVNDSDESNEEGCGLHLVDLDNDGRSEILTLTQDRGRGRVRIIELPR